MTMPPMNLIADPGRNRSSARTPHPVCRSQAPGRTPWASRSATWQQEHIEPQGLARGGESARVSSRRRRRAPRGGGGGRGWGEGGGVSGGGGVARGVCRGRRRGARRERERGRDGDSGEVLHGDGSNGLAGTMLAPAADTGGHNQVKWAGAGCLGFDRLRHTTPSWRIRLVSSRATPHRSASSTSVCSPSIGGRVTVTGESESLSGQPTV